MGPGGAAGDLGPGCPLPPKGTGAAAASTWCPRRVTVLSADRAAPRRQRRCFFKGDTRAAFLDRWTELSLFPSRPPGPGCRRRRLSLTGSGAAGAESPRRPSGPGPGVRGRRGVRSAPAQPAAGTGQNGILQGRGLGEALTAAWPRCRALTAPGPPTCTWPVRCHYPVLWASKPKGSQVVQP